MIKKLVWDHNVNFKTYSFYHALFCAFQALFSFFCISCKFCILPNTTPTFFLPFMFAFFFCHFVVLLILPFACFIPGLQILVETHVQDFRIVRFQSDTTPNLWGKEERISLNATLKISSLGKVFTCVSVVACWRISLPSLVPLEGTCSNLVLHCQIQLPL